MACAALKHDVYQAYGASAPCTCTVMVLNNVAETRAGRTRRQIRVAGRRSCSLRHNARTEAFVHVAKPFPQQKVASHQALQGAWCWRAERHGLKLAVASHRDHSAASTRGREWRVLINRAREFIGVLASQIGDAVASCVATTDKQRPGSGQDEKKLITTPIAMPITR